MSAYLLPDIAVHGFGNKHRQGRKPLINKHSMVAVAHIADKAPIKFDSYSNRENEQAQYARESFIGKIGKWAIGRKDDLYERKNHRAEARGGG